MDWEARYQTGDTPWEKGSPHPALAKLTEIPPPAGAILVPGCGFGHDVLMLARLWPDRLVLGVDIAESAVTGARARCAAQNNVRILHADYLADSPVLASGVFGMIWEHTCFCAIPPSLRADYAASAARLLAPGGLLLGVFFLRLSRASDGPPWNCPEEELREVFRPYFDVEVLGPTPATFAGRESEEFAVRMTRLPERLDPGPC